METCSCHLCVLAVYFLQNIEKRTESAEESVEVVFDPRGGAQWARSLKARGPKPILICTARPPDKHPSTLHPDVDLLSSTFGPKIGKILCRFEGIATSEGFHAYGSVRNGALAGVQVSVVKRNVAVRLLPTINVRLVALRSEEGDIENAPLEKVGDSTVMSRGKTGGAAREATLEETLTTMLNADLREEMDVELLDHDILCVEPDATVVAFGGEPCLCTRTRVFRMFVRREAVDYPFVADRDRHLLPIALPSVMALFDHICSIPDCWHVICLPGGECIGFMPESRLASYELS